MSARRIPDGDTVQGLEAAFGVPPERQEGGAAPAEAPRVPGKLTDDYAGFRFLKERPERVVDLLYPFELGGVQYHSYTLRRLNAEQMTEVARELRRVENMGVLYSAITGLPFVAIRLMDADDQEAMAAAAVGFMPASLRGLPVSPSSGATE